jgi:hypothetical protein
MVPACKKWHCHVSPTFTMCKRGTPVPRWNYFLKLFISISISMKETFERS